MTNKHPQELWKSNQADASDVDTQPAGPFSSLLRSRSLCFFRQICHISRPRGSWHAWTCSACQNGKCDATLSDHSEASLRALSTANFGIKVLEKGRKNAFRVHLQTRLSSGTYWPFFFFFFPPSFWPNENDLSKIGKKAVIALSDGFLRSEAKLPCQLILCNWQKKDKNKSRGWRRSSRSVLGCKSVTGRDGDIWHFTPCWRPWVRRPPVKESHPLSPRLSFLLSPASLCSCHLMQLVSSRHHPAFSPPRTLVFIFSNDAFINHAEGQSDLFHTFSFYIFPFFFFSFQIYHSPIHKQAESKSLTITHICIQSFAFYLPVVFFPPLTVELNETGFKFLRKCINYIETKGEVHPGCFFLVPSDSLRGA